MVGEEASASSRGGILGAPPSESTMVRRVDREDRVESGEDLTCVEGPRRP